MLSPILTYRNLIVLLPPVYILLARGVTRLTSNSGKLAATLFITALFVYQIVVGGYYQTPTKTQFREAAAFIAEQEAMYPDGMIVGQFAYPFLLDHYLASSGSAQRVDVIVEKDRLCLGQTYLETNQAGLSICPTVSGDFAYQLTTGATQEPGGNHAFQSLAEQPDAHKLGQLVNARNPAVIWFVHGRGELAIDPENFVPGFELFRHKDFAGVSVYLFMN